MRNVTACSFIIAVSCLSSVLGQQQQTGRALSLADVRALIGIPTPDAAIVLAIKARGVDFVPTDELVDSLHDLGAGPHTQKALRELVPHATLTIAAELPDCEVLVDGRIRGRTGVDGRLNVASLAIRSYEVVVRKTDYADFTENVALAVPGTTIQARLVSDRPANVDAALAKWRSLNAQLLDIESDYRQRIQRATGAVEARYDDLITTVGMSKPVKDTFETTKDYKAKMAKHDEQMSQINSRRQSEVAQIRTNYEAERNGATARLQRTRTLIESGYYPRPGGPKPLWRNYDADRSELWIGLGGTVLTCSVPPNDARSANVNRESLEMKSHYRFSTSGAEADGEALLHPAFSEPRSCGKLNPERFPIKLKQLLDSRNIDAFRKEAAFALEVGAGSLVQVKLLHHHGSFSLQANRFHEATLGIERPGLYLDLQQPAEGQAGRLSLDRIKDVKIVREGATGVLLNIVVSSGKNLDKRTPLNFAVLGSRFAQEAETKQYKFGTTTTTKDRVQSPPGAGDQLGAIAWLIDQIRSQAASNRSQ